MVIKYLSQGVACGRYSLQNHHSSSPMLSHWTPSKATLPARSGPAHRILQSLGDFSFDLLPQDQTVSSHVCFQPQLQSRSWLQICDRLERKFPSMSKSCLNRVGFGQGQRIQVAESSCYLGAFRLFQLCGPIFIPKDQAHGGYFQKATAHSSSWHS